MIIFLFNDFIYIVGDRINNKKIIISLFSLSFGFFITGVLAYFYNNSSIQNRFVSGTYKTVTTEEFTSPTNWLPWDDPCTNYYVGEKLVYPKDNESCNGSN